MIGMTACIDHAAATYHVRPAYIETVIEAPHTPGSIGPMGIPSAWLPVLVRNGFNLSKLSIDNCANINAGAWILSVNPQSSVSSSPPGAPGQGENLPACAIEASDAYRVPIADIERVMAAPHSAGSIGPMGIPSAWVSLLRQYGFNTYLVEHDTCMGMVAGIWIMGVENLQWGGGDLKTVHINGVIMPPGWMLDIFKRAAAVYHISLEVLLAVADQESGFQPGVTSSAGAQGVMQLMPKTATRYQVSDAFNAEENIMGGAAYLSDLQSQFNSNLPLMFAAYNAGSQAVEDYGNKIPPFEETEIYVPSVLARLKAYQNRGVPAEPSPTPVMQVSAPHVPATIASPLHIPMTITFFHAPEKPAHVRVANAG